MMALQLDFSKSQARGRAVEDNFMTFIFQSAFNKNIDIHKQGAEEGIEYGSN